MDVLFDVPFDVLGVVSLYITKHPMKLLDWIPPMMINITGLAGNPNSMHILENYYEFINIQNLAQYNTNPEAILLFENKLRTHTHIICLSSNPNGIYLLESYPDSINWWSLSKNPNGLALLNANPDKINWSGLSANPNPDSIHMLEANPDKIDWTELSYNPSGMALLEANPDKIIWSGLSANPNGIILLKANPDKINWDSLSSNPNGIHLLKNNITNKYICWWSLSKNPSIFEPDTKQYYVNLQNKIIKIDNIIN